MSTFAFPVITIDGGAACGKGALAVHLAKTLGFNYLDSGVYYRALGYQAIIQGVADDDESKLIILAQTMQLSFVDGKILMQDLDNGNKYIDITNFIRTEEVSMRSSKVSMFADVRNALMQKQHEALVAPGLVAEGRDMGTVVFPKAEVKIFMICDLAKRAERRILQLEKQGIDANISDVYEALAKRDERDLNRAVAPLKAAANAHVVDNTMLSLEEVVSSCVKICRNQLSSLLAS